MPTAPPDRTPTPDAAGATRGGGRGRSSPANSDREQALSRAEIVAATIAWVDREGIGTFSMRKLAASLGITGPALYWHFRDRGDLLGAAANAVLDGVDSRRRRGQAWDVAIRRMLMSLWRAAKAHPGLLDVLRTQPLHIGAGQRLMQSMLVTLREAGFEADAAVDHTRSLLWTTFGFIRGTAATLERLDGLGQGAAIELELDMSSLDPAAQTLIAPCLPRLATLDIDGLFERTLDALIAGLGDPVTPRS